MSPSIWKMKIAKPIRDVYYDQRSNYDLLASKVTDILKARSEEKKWFYTSRVKSLESFAQKIETGRVKHPSAMEDFFACTLVVPTSDQVTLARNLVRAQFEVIYQRPRHENKTHKASSSFVFDDLRIYVRMKGLDVDRSLTLKGVIFEVQIKTILQHAWAIATHDLIYKSASVDWPLERIAYQIKAMLEHAEIAIFKANDLAQAPVVAKEDKRTAAITHLLRHIEDTWDRDKLPQNLRGLSESIFEVLAICGLRVDCFPTIIENEQRRFGSLPLDLSPYAFTVQALANSSDVDLEEKLNSAQNGVRVVTHSGMELPDWMSSEHPRVLYLG